MKILAVLYLGGGPLNIHQALTILVSKLRWSTGEYTGVVDQISAFFLKIQLVSLEVYDEAVSALNCDLLLDACLIRAKDRHRYPEIVFFHVDRFNAI